MATGDCVEVGVSVMVGVKVDVLKRAVVGIGVSVFLAVGVAMEVGDSFKSVGDKTCGRTPSVGVNMVPFEQEEIITTNKRREPIL